jgi:hypothetical protein
MKAEMGAPVRQPRSTALLAKRLWRANIPMAAIKMTVAVIPKILTKARAAFTEVRMESRWKPARDRRDAGFRP